MHRKHAVLKSVDLVKVGEVTSDTTKIADTTSGATKMGDMTSNTAKPIVMTSGPNTIAGQFTLKPLLLVDARFPRVDVTDVVCGEYSEPAIDTSKLSCLLPGAVATRSELPAKGLKIREPHNWMGVSISDLGRGYAWSDYIQLVGVAWWVDG